MLNDVVFVLGMGRSGTSALTRVLSICGASLPTELLPANFSNQAGHWEPIRALEINDRFLSKNGSNWYDPTLRVQAANGERGERHFEFVSEIMGFLDRCPKQQTLVIKDPRITAVADCWFEAVERLGGTAKIIIAVRAAVPVAASLAARDGLSLELSSALWLKYNILAVKAAMGRSRVFVGFDNLLSNWKRQILRISSQIGVDLNLVSEDEVNGFLRADLRHHHSTVELTEVFGGAWIGRLDSALLQAADDIASPDCVVDETHAALLDGRINIERAVADFDGRTYMQFQSSPRG